MSHLIDLQTEQLLKQDPLLRPYQSILRRRLLKIAQTEKHLTKDGMSLEDFASGHEFYGLHRTGDGWVFREWAPNATAVYFIGDMTGWQEHRDFLMKRINDNGDWELRLPLEAVHHENFYRLKVHWADGEGDRIPVYARRVVQNEKTLIFNAQVWRPDAPYQWEYSASFDTVEPLFIYEVHVGMAQQEEKIGSFKEFTDRVLPRIVSSGYNTLQLMALQEHPYYASFGYQVSSFFAASSRFGTPDDLKALIDAAHGAGLRVIMDLIHSHGVINEVEGLSRFDGTLYQYFHEGERGSHPAWNSRCFDYSKRQVLHFLLSNCRYWLDEYRLDGFRFDGITSMLYNHHGLGRAFTSYDDYFNDPVDEDAVTYLALANRVIHRLRPDAVTIAEDVSGMPGLAVPEMNGGIGFDYRFAMGIPDFWIRLTKDMRDEDWPMGYLWYELTNRRKDEKTISYAESHDQALVGDQTLIFRMTGAAMYAHMEQADGNLTIERGMSLHKMIRLLTLSTAGHGYLNFMGNEFGHPEWIDFPREENGWSYRYARRQWHLADAHHLKYRMLARFDRDMIRLAKQFRLLAEGDPSLICEHNDDKVIAFVRAGLIFVFNFHPSTSYTDYSIHVAPGRYRLIFDSDADSYGGHGRLDKAREHVYDAGPRKEGRAPWISLYLPTRTALVLAGEEHSKEHLLQP
jgi:1,4-alpha-glucan branching enzyme